ncbi:MAG: tail fiber domain-containing protein [Bacteroidales bacterium]|nr:tail fiber domain-containing protein [Bacteroidales bacterium]
MKKYICIILILTSTQLVVIAQNVGISNESITPHSSSILEVRSQDKGLLIPRLSLTNTNLSTPVSSPATSLLVYNTATVNDVTPGYYYWEGTKWVKFGASTSGVSMDCNENNYLTKRLNSSSLSCSQIYDNGSNVQIGTTALTNCKFGISYASTDIYGIYVTMPGTAIYGDASGATGQGVRGRGGDYGVKGEHLTKSPYGILGTAYEGIECYSNEYDSYGIKAIGGDNAIGALWAQAGDGKLSGYFGGMAKFYTQYAGQFAIQATRNTLTTNTSPSSVMELVRKTTASTMGTNMGVGLLFSLEYGNSNNKEYMGAIYAAYNGATDQGRLTFNTRSGGSVPTEKMTVLHNGNVGIGVSYPSEKLVVYNGTSTGQYTSTGWTHSSDQRLKKNIINMETALEKVLLLSPKRFDYNTEENNNSNHIGLIAQEVELLFPEFVHTDADGMKSIAYGEMTPVLIQSIKEQQQQIELMMQMLKDQKERIIALEQQQ